MGPALQKQNFFRVNITDQFEKTKTVLHVEFSGCDKLTW